MRHGMFDPVYVENIDIQNAMKHVLCTGEDHCTSLTDQTVAKVPYATADLCIGAVQERLSLSLAMRLVQDSTKRAGKLQDMTEACLCCRTEHDVINMKLNCTIAVFVNLREQKRCGELQNL